MSKKKTHKEYVTEVTEKNPNVEVIGEYINRRTNIVHRCKVCGYGSNGEWIPWPGNILRGEKCPKCAVDAMKKTHEKYITDVANKNSNIEVTGRYVNSKIGIFHRCKICGYGSNGEWMPCPNSILRDEGCPVCGGQAIGPPPEYKNSIWASKYRDLAIYYGITEEQMKLIMPMSNKKINIKCPNCGYIKLISFYNLFTYGIRCNKCSDGISYPEKFMMSFLDQLHINYKSQYSPGWVGGKKYDFYLPDYNCIIETHGEQHYKESNFSKKNGKSLENEQQNDLNKKNFAQQNGIDKYIVIDCRKSTLQWIKDNILSSGLINILSIDEDMIDWSVCSINAINSNVKKVADIWMNNKIMTTGDIAKIMNVSMSSVDRWIKKAAECGICDYTKEKGLKRMRSDNWKNKLSESHKGKCTGESNSNSRKVIRLSDLTRYECVNDAAKDNNVDRHTMSKYCKFCKNFMYYDEWLTQQND